MERSGDKFLQIFNELEHILSEQVGGYEHKTFSMLLDRVGDRLPTVRRQMKFLQSMGNLRNTIVHGKGYPRDIIADPRQEIVDKFEQILGSIRSPVRVDQKFLRDLQVFELGTCFEDILSHMRENDYSQVVVRVENEHKIITSEAIVKWLSVAADNTQSFASAPVQKAYEHEEGYVQDWISRKAPVDEALQIFNDALQRKIPRLHAILITENGKPTEKPIGIITPWDLVGILKEDMF